MLFGTGSTIYFDIWSYLLLQASFSILVMLFSQDITLLLFSPCSIKHFSRKDFDFEALRKSWPWDQPHIQNMSWWYYPLTIHSNEIWTIKEAKQEYNLINNQLVKNHIFFKCLQGTKNWSWYSLKILPSYFFTLFNHFSWKDFGKIKPVKVFI